MKLPLRIAGSIQSKSQLTQSGLLFVLAGIGLLTFFQGRHLLKASSGGNSPSHQMAQALQARLTGVSDGLTGYLEHHDAAALERIKSEGKEASRLLDTFKEEFSQGENDPLLKRIGSAQEDMRAATVSLLAVDHALITQQMTLARSKEELQNFSAARRRSRRARETKNLLEKRVSGDQELAHQTEEQRKAALDHYRQTRDALELTLKENESRLGGRSRNLRAAISSGMAFSAAAGALVFCGVILILLTSRRTERELVKPLREVLQCVEAAAAGDLSRVPDHWSQDEVGQLSQAAGRLISVLARSENLVYHLAALVESSGEAIISHNLEGTILSWNKGAQRIYGYSAEEVKGRSITILNPEDSGSEMTRHLQRIRDGERIQPFETLHLARNGRRVRALVRVSAILDSTRKVIGASFCAQDLTDTQLLKSTPTEESRAA